MLNPLRPFSLPELSVLGNESVAAPLEAALRQHVHEWQEEQQEQTGEPAASALRRNLLRVLQLDALPLATTTNRDDFMLECCVCYTYKLEDVSLAHMHALG